MAQLLYSGLSPRARGREFPPATMSMTRSYFRRKQKKTRPQELTGCWVPHLTNCIYPATWNLSDSLSYLYQLIIIIINIIIIIIIIITYYYYYYYHYFYWILSRSSSIHLWSSNLFPPCCMHCKTCTAGSYCGCNSSSTHLPDSTGGNQAMN